MIPSFKEKAYKAHSNKYDYSKVNYINAHSKVEIICKEHGSFWQTPNNHLSGHGCLKCGTESTSYLRSKKIEQCINDFKKIHGDRYDYSKVKYINSRTKVIINCKLHGEFEQRPYDHISGKGCSKCGINTIKVKKSLKKEDFINRSNIVHNNKYDYKYVEYSNNYTSVEIICPKHGIFKQKPVDHLCGKGCKKCGMKRAADVRKFSEEIFIKKAIEVHGNKYDYSNIEYDNSRTKISIICKKHGIFEQKPNNHLMGHNCPKCSNFISKPEIQIQEFLASEGFDIQTNTRKIIPPYELDIYIPKLKKAIEFNGMYWHYSEDYFAMGKHAHKSKLCRQKGIKLFHLREDLWLKDREKMKQIILKFLENEQRKQNS